MEIKSNTFLCSDRHKKIEEAIRAGHDKDYITKCVYEQQESRYLEGKLNRAECKRIVYQIAYDVYMQNLREIGAVRA